MTHRLIGESIYKLAELYDDGEISRDDLIESLTEWDYEGNPLDTSEDRDAEGKPLRGTFAEVEEAYYESLIDSDLFDIAFAAATKE